MGALQIFAPGWPTDLLRAAILFDPLSLGSVASLLTLKKAASGFIAQV